MNLLMRRRAMMQQKQGGGGLPDTYQQVEWIGCSGTQYIKTNYAVTQGDELSATYMLTSTSGNNNKALWSAGTGDYQFILLLNGSRQFYFKYFATGDATGLRPASANYNHKTQYTVSSSGACDIYIIDLDQHTTGTSTYGAPIDGTNELHIFLRADHSSTYYRGRLYDFTITNNGVTKLNLIPCYRKSDNEIGVYDTVGQKFYTNAGTGTFTIPT